MKYVDEFRERGRCQVVLDRIIKRSTRKWTIMEVCGGQTHGLLRFGIDEALSRQVQLVHGPGCPVCVTSAEAIDRAIELSLRPNTVVLTFGDMLRVPGSQRSLMQTQALGGSVQAVYSPLDAITLATQQPEKQFVFFAVGFETTLPATAIAVLQASESGLKNLSFLLAHVRVSPAMQFVLEQPECSIDGFLAAGHVCTIMGIEECVKISMDYQVPIVVTGFEPLDLLLGIEECVRLLEAKENVVSNLYRRVVNDVGNPSAKRLIAEVFEVDDQDWRGLGHIHQGGFRLTQTYAEWDAANLLVNHGGEGAGWLGRDGSFRQSDECLSGQVLTGKIKPTDCPHFGKRCNPESPLGAPMVSSEGACAAYYQYAQEKVRFSGVDHEGKEYEPT